MGVVVVHISESLYHCKSQSQAVSEGAMILRLGSTVSGLQVRHLVVELYNLLTGSLEATLAVHQRKAFVHGLSSRTGTLASFHLDYSTRKGSKCFQLQ